MVKSKIFVRWNQMNQLFGIGNSIISVFLPFFSDLCVCPVFCPFPYFPSNTKTQCLFPYFDIYFRDTFVCFCWFIRFWHRAHTRRSLAGDYNSVVLVSHVPIAPEKKWWKQMRQICFKRRMESNLRSRAPSQLIVHPLAYLQPMATSISNFRPFSWENWRISMATVICWNHKVEIVAALH